VCVRNLSRVQRGRDDPAQERDIAVMQRGADATWRAVDGFLGHDETRFVCADATVPVPHSCLP
jgi:hypothetical protein